MNPKIGVCDACQARFKIPAEFRADRARCRQCGGVVRIGGGAPVVRTRPVRRNEGRPQSSARELPDSPEHAVVPATPRSNAPLHSTAGATPQATSAPARLEPATLHDAGPRLDDEPALPRVALRAADNDLAADANTDSARPRARRAYVAYILAALAVVALALVAWRLTRSDVPASAAPSTDHR